VEKSEKPGAEKSSGKKGHAFGGRKFQPKKDEGKGDKPQGEGGKTTAEIEKNKLEGEKRRSQTGNCLTLPCGGRKENCRADGKGESQIDGKGERTVMKGSPTPWSRRGKQKTTKEDGKNDSSMLSLGKEKGGD